MLIKNYSLKNLNSFGIDVHSAYYYRLEDLSGLNELINEINGRKINYMILGEGSNVLFTSDFDGLIIHNCLKGIETIFEDSAHIAIKASAGENWDNFVAKIVDMGYGGLENLSFIPGSVGASPVQNIGAYGTEVKDRILELEGYSLPEHSFHILRNEECKFSYRDSIFKREKKNRFLITAVTFLLDKEPVFNLKYGNLAELFRKKAVQTLETLRETVIDIRRSKLPDISEYASAGSFFKNPQISGDKFEMLKELYPDIPGYFTDSNVKVPAAWLIEKAGWKGVMEGRVGTWPSQALVIVNYGKAGGKDVFLFSEKIRMSVQEKFGIELEREVNVL